MSVHAIYVNDQNHYKMKYIQNLNVFLTLISFSPVSLCTLLQIFYGLEKINVILFGLSFVDLS